MSNKLIEGEMINNWVVISPYGLKNRCVHYWVECRCGFRGVRSPTQIRKTKQCRGCSRSEQTAQGGTRRTHGATAENSEFFTTYMAWHYMRSRCKGKNSKDKKNYLDRGIKVCERWDKSFEIFLEDMGKKPDNTSLDRIDNEKGYCKENCRWASVSEQNDNKRGCIYHKYNGETLTISRWAERLEITRSRADYWIKSKGIDWVVKNIDLIKKIKTGMSNKQYENLGLGKRKGSGNRKHSSSRDKSHPLHKMYKSWDYMKNTKKNMCDSWLKFESFVEDMGQKPEGKRLLRYDTSRQFNKENCYWG